MMILVIDRSSDELLSIEKKPNMSFSEMPRSDLVQASRAISLAFVSILSLEILRRVIVHSLDLHCLE
jgi:hypothetical protein